MSTNHVHQPPDRYSDRLLERLRPHIELDLVDGEEVERDYLRAACAAHEFEVTEQVLDVLAAANDGSFLAAQEHLSGLARERPGPRDLTEEEAQGLEQACRQSWRQRVLSELPGEQQIAVELASILSACAVPLRREFLHALNRERACGTSWQRITYRHAQGHKLDRALDGLATGPFPEEAGEFRPHGSRLEDENRTALIEETAQVGRALFRLGAERVPAAGLRTALAGLDETLWVRQRVDMLIPLNTGRGAISLPSRLRRKACAGLSRSFVVPATLLSENAHPDAWAGAMVLLGRRYNELPTGSSASNQLRAIECSQRALNVYTLERYPYNWATTHNNLGNAWASLPTGDRADNLRKAIECLENAAQVFTEHDYPERWAITQNNLGEAWRRLPTGDRTENLSKATRLHLNALRVYTKRDYPEGWAGSHLNLGACYTELPTGDRAENVRKAIECYEAALIVYTEGDHPHHWAMTQNNLGNAWSDMPTGDRTDNLRRAIDHYQAALRVHTEQGYPEYWAATQDNLGRAWAQLSTGDRAQNLGKAIECYQAVLRVYTEQAFPQEWAMTQGNLAVVRLQLAHEENPPENLTAAEEHATEALRVFTAEAFPEHNRKAVHLLQAIKRARENP